MLKQSPSQSHLRNFQNQRKEASPRKPAVGLFASDRPSPKICATQGKESVFPAARHFSSEVQQTNTFERFERLFLSSGGGFIRGAMRPIHKPNELFSCNKDCCHRWNSPVTTRYSLRITPLVRTLLSSGGIDSSDKPLITETEKTYL